MAEDHDGGEHTIGRILPLIGNRFTQEVSQSLHMGKPLVVRNEGQLELLIDYILRRDKTGQDYPVSGVTPEYFISESGLGVEFLQEAKKGEKCQWRDCSRKVFSLFPNWLHLLPQYALGEAKVDVVSLVIG